MTVGKRWVVRGAVTLTAASVVALAGLAPLVSAPRLLPDNNRPPPVVGAIVEAQPDTTQAGSNLVPARPEALVDLQLAAEFVARGDFAPALIKYQALLDNAPDVLVPVGEGLFAPVVDYIQRQIAALPDEGLTLYRRQVDPAVQRALARFRDDDDSSALADVVQKSRHATEGAMAVMMAARRSTDDGDLARAAALWALLANEYPHLPAETRALALVELGLCYSLMSQPSAAALVAKRLNREFQLTVIIAGGRRVRAAAFLENALASAEFSPLRATDTTSSPTASRTQWAGRAEGFQLMAAADIPLVPRWHQRPPRQTQGTPTDIWTSAQPHPALHGSPTNDRGAALAATYQRLCRLPSVAGLASPPRLWPAPIPAVADHVAYALLGHGVIAVDTLSGQRLWQVPQFGTADTTLESRPAGDSTVGLPDDRPPISTAELFPLDLGRMGLSLAGSLVITVEGPHGVLALDEFNTNTALVRSGEPSPGPPSWLVARDARTGKPVWHHGGQPYKPGMPADVTDPRWTRTFLTQAQWLVAPTVVDDHWLLTVARFGPAYYGVCLHAATGHLKWARRISNRPDILRLTTGPHQAEGVVTTETRDIGSPPAVHGSTAYFLTNAGVLAALDLTDGAVVWIRHYSATTPRDTIPPNRPAQAPGMMAAPGMVSPATRLAAASAYHPPNPVITHDNTVVILPSDHHQLLAFDGRDGRSLWAVSRDLPTPEGETCQLSLLAGLAGQRIVATGADAAAFDLATGGLAWLAQSRFQPAGADQNTAQPPPLGRAALSATTLYMPGYAGQIDRVDVASGRLLSPLRADAAAVCATDRQLTLGATLIATGNELIAATNEGLTGYFDLATAWDRAKAQRAGAPQQAQSYLTHGRLAMMAAATDPAALAVALADLTTAADLALKAHQMALHEQAQSALYQFWISQADRADHPRAVLEALERARPYTQNHDSRTADWLWRRYTQACADGQFALAADMARALAAMPQSVTLEGTHPTGPSASGSRSLTAAAPVYSARQVGQASLRHLITQQGRQVVAAHESQAANQLVTALGMADANARRAALQRLVQQAPHTLVAAEALMVLANDHDLCARAILADSASDLQARAQATRHTKQARLALDAITADPQYAESPVWLSAMFACFTLDYGTNQRQALNWLVRLAHALGQHAFDSPPTCLWGPYRGRPLDELLDQTLTQLQMGLTAKQLASHFTPDDFSPQAQTPTTRAAPDSQATPPATMVPTIVRDAAGQPLVRSLWEIFVLHDNSLSHIDIASGRTLWVASWPRDPSVPTLAAHMRPACVGAVADDVITCHNGTQLIEVHIPSGKLLAVEPTAPPPHTTVNSRFVNPSATMLANRRAAWIVHKLDTNAKPPARSLSLINSGASDRLQLVLTQPTTGVSITRTFDLPSTAMSVGYANRAPLPALTETHVAVVTAPNTLTCYATSDLHTVFTAPMVGLPTSLRFIEDRLLLALSQGNGSAAGIRAYDLSGRLLWSYTPPLDISLAPAVGAAARQALVEVIAADLDTTLVMVRRFSPNSGQVVAIDTLTGTPRWSYGCAVTVAANPNSWRNPIGAVATPSTLWVFVGSAWPNPAVSTPMTYCRSPELHALDICTGQRLWRTALPPSPIASQVCHMVHATPSQLLWPLRDPQTRATLLWRFDRATGRLLASPGSPLTLTPNTKLQTPAKSSLMLHAPWPVMIGGLLLAESPDGILVWGPLPPARTSTQQGPPALKP